MAEYSAELHDLLFPRTLILNQQYTSPG